MADHDESLSLQPMVVSDEASSLTIPSTEAADQALGDVAGGTTLITPALYDTGPTSNLQDVLEFAPGVYASNRGGDEVRLSIRGSGLSQAFAVKGIRYLRNGLPISEADGDFHSQAIEPLTARHIEIYRGANAMQYGATTLGGAVNFVTHTGHTAAPLKLRMEAGSDGHLRPQISGGDVLGGGWDYYASLSGSYLDGFRDQQETDSTRFYGNLGRRWNADHESRLHVDIMNHEQELPGGITLTDLKADPTQANGFFETFNSQNDFNRYRVELQHGMNLRQADHLNIGVYAETQTIDHPLGFGIFDEEQDNYGFSLRHEIFMRPGGRDNTLTWGGLIAVGDVDLREFTPLPGAVRGPLRQIEQSDVLTAEWFAENRWRFAEHWTLITGLQLAYADRETDFTDPLTNTTTALDEDYAGISPKLGLLWQTRPSLQLFANVSRSFEPPILAEFNNAFDPVTGAVNPALKLDEQTATTFEIGSRGSLAALLNWELAVYHSLIDDELLTVEVNQPGARFATANADDTTHSGIEFGVDGRVSVDFAPGHLRWRSAFTYNRFRFDNDPAFGDNTLPGIPEYFGNTEIIYHHPRGYYLGPTLQYASDYYIDFANSFKAPSFVTVGFRAGYDDPRDRFRLFLEGRNLEDEAFVANTTTVADAGGRDQTVFNPGQELAFFGGIEISF